MNSGHQRQEEKGNGFISKKRKLLPSRREVTRDSQGKCTLCEIEAFFKQYQPTIKINIYVLLVMWQDEKAEENAFTDARRSVEKFGDIVFTIFTLGLNKLIPRIIKKLFKG